MKNIKKEVEKLQKEMIDEIWKYHKDILAETKIKSKSDITTGFLDLDDEYCSLSWEMGYVRALQEVLTILNNK